MIFCWRITLESLIVSIIVAIPILLILGNLIDIPNRPLSHWSMTKRFWWTVIIGPVIETILFQALPISIARLLRVTFKWQVVTSMILFASAHFTSGIGVGIAAGVVGGFYFAFTYAHWANYSKITALWVTTVSHAFRNAISLLIVTLIKFGVGLNNS